MGGANDAKIPLGQIINHERAAMVSNVALRTIQTQAVVGRQVTGCIAKLRRGTCAELKVHSTFVYCSVENCERLHNQIQ